MFPSVEIQDVTLHTVGGQSENIQNLVKTIDIFEDVLRPYITADIFVEDFIGFSDKIELLGNQYVTIALRSPFKGKKAVEYKLWVNSIKNMTVAKNRKGRYFAINCVSEEVLKNSSRIVNRQFDTEHSVMVEEIFSNYLESEKEIKLIEKTKGAQKLQIANLKPLEAIDLIRRRAVSPDNIGSAYVFFERPEGYVFSTFEKLFEEGKGNIGDKVFSLLTPAVATNPELIHRSILGYQQLSMFDTAKHIGAGGYNNVVNSYDILTGETRKVEYKIEEKIGDYKYPTKNPKGIPTREIYDRFGQTPALRYFHTHDSSLGEQQFTADIIGSRIGFIQQIVANLLRVHLAGDTDIHAGDTINLRFPKADAAVNEADPYLSGNYLVARLRHIISNVPNINYTMSCECIRGTFAEDE